MKCEICDKEYRSVVALSQHIKQTHNIEAQYYYDNYINTQRHLCFCGNKTRFINMNLGYVNTCGNKCAAILKRTELKRDPEKYTAFCKKVTNNQKQIWLNRSLTGEDKEIRYKIRETQTQTISKMSADERRERFGYLNKKSEEEKTKIVGKMILNNKPFKNIKHFVPKNPQKYTGRYPIISRSNWEYMFMQWLDLTPGIKEWSSESVTIPYFDPVTQKRRRYYPDFLVNKRYLIEVKPKRDIVLTKKGRLNRAQKLMREQVYTTNQAKFQAAEDYCRKAGLEFKVLTEQHLFNK